MNIFTDNLHRIAYATDASAYREVPEGVAFPKTDEDVRDLILEARRRGLCIIPRGAGTSVAGQVVGRGIVVDVSRYLNRILEINAEQRWVRVQPGVVRDELNLALRPYGLFFSPETSTSNRCCIGGMVGNNSCGTHSLIYGSTRHHLLAVKGFLSDGSYFDTEAPSGAGGVGSFDADGGFVVGCSGLAGGAAGGFAAGDFVAGGPEGVGSFDADGGSGRSGAFVAAGADGVAGGFGLAGGAARGFAAGDFVAGGPEGVGSFDADGGSGRSGAFVAAGADGVAGGSEGGGSFDADGAFPVLGSTRSSLERAIYAQLEGWRSDPEVRRLLRENFPDPSLKRRSCGYAIDEAVLGGFVAGGASDSGGPSTFRGDFVDGKGVSGEDLCKIICGSEGTLCFVTEVKLSLDPLPAERTMVLCAHCKSLEDSFLVNLVALRHSPLAVELMDGKILDLAKGNPEAARNRFFVEGDPAALIIAEFPLAGAPSATGLADGLAGAPSVVGSAAGLAGAPSATGLAAGPSTFGADFVDGKGDFGSPSTFEGGFVDGKAGFGGPSTFGGDFVDGKGDFGGPGSYLPSALRGAASKGSPRSSEDNCPEGEQAPFSFWGAAGAAGTAGGNDFGAVGTAGAVGVAGAAGAAGSAGWNAVGAGGAAGSAGTAGAVGWNAVGAAGAAGVAGAAETAGGAGSAGWNAVGAAGADGVGEAAGTAGIAGGGVCREADELEKELAESSLAYCCTRVYGEDVARVWALRKAGLGVLGGMKGDAKPVGVIEDTAVAPERLPEYMADFRKMLAGMGLECVFYGHISTGELHLRPVLNLKTAEGRRLFREVATETAKLVRKHKGSLSGEHGDGRLRGEFIPLMYGEECYRMMREVKRCWDPDGVFNVGKVVDTPRMDEFLRYELGQRYRLEECLAGGAVDGGFVDGGFSDGGFSDGGFADGGFSDGGFADGRARGCLPSALRGAASKCSSRSSEDNCPSDSGGPSTFGGDFVDGKAGFGGPSTFRADFVDGKGDFGGSSTFGGDFVDGKGDFGGPSTFEADFVDGKADSGGPSTFGADFVDGKADSGGPSTFEGDFVDGKRVSGRVARVRGLMCSVEQCNGAGDCRKSALVGGTMCPAYKVSDREELMTTRARANIIREALTRGIDGRVLDSPELREVLSSCLACKACKAECPSNVDMTRIRAEVLQLIYDQEGTPRRACMVARMAAVERLGSFVAPIYNFFAGWRPSANIIKKFVGFAPERSIPTVHRWRPELLEGERGTDVLPGGVSSARGLAGPSTFEGDFVDGKAGFGGPSTFGADFVDGKGDFGGPSTFEGDFVDGKGDFGGPSTFGADFVDGKGDFGGPSTFGADFVDGKGDSGGPSTFRGDFVDGGFSDGRAGSYLPSALRGAASKGSPRSPEDNCPEGVKVPSLFCGAAGVAGAAGGAGAAGNVGGNAAGGAGRRVYLFIDEFTKYQEPWLAVKLKRLLESLGYEVVVPENVESGRAAISKGCLKLARKFAVKNVKLLGKLVSEDAPLVGIEPSCILSFRDEYPDLVPAELRQAAERLAGNSLLYDEFFVREIAAGRISPDDFRDDGCEIWLHGHCHQKALVGIDKTVSMLRLLKGADVHVIPSGCCGMAGSFGYEKEHYRTSLSIGEMVLFPAVRKACGLNEVESGDVGTDAAGSSEQEGQSGVGRCGAAEGAGRTVSGGDVSPETGSRAEGWPGGAGSFGTSEGRVEPGAGGLENGSRPEGAGSFGASEGRTEPGAGSLENGARPESAGSFGTSEGRVEPGAGGLENGARPEGAGSFGASEGRTEPGAGGLENGARTGGRPVFVAAPGTSCRQQIFDGTGVRAVHPIEILSAWKRL